jgi:transcriptional regulator with GAF, ATPase, and Fis domain
MRRAAVQRPALPSSPYDALAATEHMLARLRASAGATRVSVWVYEATTEMVVPFRSVAADSAGPADDDPRLRIPVTLDQSPFLSTVIRNQQPVVARADGRRAADKEIVEFGLRSAHGEPLVLDGKVVGVLTVEPAAAAAPHLLRQVGPKLAAATAEAWTRRSDERRLAQAEVLLRLIESAGAAGSTDQLLSSVCRELADLDEVEHAVIFLLEDGKLAPSMAADARGTRTQLRNAHVAMHLAETVLGTGEPSALASCLGVPLGGMPDVLGVLVLESTAARPFPEDVRRLAAAAGAHLGGVIGQMRRPQLVGR